MSKDAIILIPDADSPLSLKVVTSLAISGYRNIHGISIQKNHRIKYSKHCTYHYVKTDCSTSKVFYDFVVDLIQEYNVDLLLPVLQRGITFCKANSKALNKLTKIGLVPELDQMLKVNFKDQLAIYLAKTKFPHPKTKTISAENDFDSAFNDMKFPVLLKPTKRAGGSGIIRCDSRTNLLEQLGKIRKDQIGNYLVQEFIEGLDAGFSCLCKDGVIVAYTIHKAYLPPYKQYQIPLSIQFFKDDAILKYMTELVRSLNWNGVFDLDMILVKGSKEIKIIEINPRFWASLYASLSAGINFADLYVRASLGEAIGQQDYNNIKFVRLKIGMIKRLSFYFRSFKWKETDLKFFKYDFLSELAVLALNAA